MMKPLPKKTSKWIVCIAVFILISNVYSQTINSVVTTESRCPSSGSATVTVSGGTTPYSYQIIAGPITRPLQSSNVFLNLPPGTYTFRVTDNIGGTATKTATVAGTYSLIGITTRTVNPTCASPNNNGEIWITPTLGTGRKPYRYVIIRTIGEAPTPDTIKFKSSDSFATGLKAGTYMVQVWDSCDNFQTRTIVLNRQLPHGWNISTPNQCRTLPKYNGNVCDSVDLRMPFTQTSTQNYWAMPITIGAHSTSGTLLDSFNVSFIVPGSLNKTVYNPTGSAMVLYAKDACGITHIYNVAQIPAVVLTSYVLYSGCSGTADLLIDKNCGLVGYNYVAGYQIAGSHNLASKKYPLLHFEIIAGPVLRGIQDSAAFRNLPAGTYTIRVTDTCGRVFTTNRTINAAIPWTVSSVNCRPSDCMVGRVGIEQFVIGGSALAGMKYSARLTSGPAGMTYPILIPVDNGLVNIKFTRWPSSLKIKDSLLAGTYNLEVSDTCGRVVNYSAVLNCPLTFNQTVKPVVGCGLNDGKAEITLSTNHYALTGRFYTLAGVPIGPLYYIGSLYGVPSFTMTYNNLTANSKYYWQLNSVQNNCFGIRRDTITIPSYVQPSINRADFVSCSDGTMTIAVAPDSSSGKLPYRFEITSGPVTRPPQRSRFFSGLPIGSYTVRMADTCNNSVSTAISGSPWTGNVNITGVGTCMYFGDTVVASIDSIFPGSYQWIQLGTGTIKNNHRTWQINGIKPADTGYYVAKMTFGACVVWLDTVHVSIPNCPYTGAIGGVVWNDQNVNGVVNSGESTIAGAKVYLFDLKRNRWVDSAITGLGGTYSFPYTGPGRYRIKITYSGLRPTYKKLGLDSVIDSDLDTTTGISDVIFIGPNIQNLTIYGGFTALVPLGKFVQLFNANKIGKNSVLINWAISNENKLISFELQRRKNLLPFETVKTYETSKVSDVKFYSYTDIFNESTFGQFTYRLKLLSPQGVEYSNSNSIQFLRTLNNNEFTISPNPAAENVYINTGFEYGFHYAISNLEGKILIYGESTAADVYLNTSNLPSGIYVIAVHDSSNRISRKLVINK